MTVPALIMLSILMITCAGEKPLKPTLYIIGDSTVRNGRGDGRDGLWGWGDYLAGHPGGEPCPGRKKQPDLSDRGALGPYT